MTDLDNMKSAFENRLEARRAEHKARLEQDIQAIRAFNASLPPRFAELAARIETTQFQSSISAHQSAHQLAEMTSSSQLRALDDTFIDLFNLSAYYPTSKLLYPTVYCETIEEFFQPIVAQMNISAAARHATLQELVQKTKENANSRGMGIYGVNIPGKGAYINGWLFGYTRQMSAREAYQDPEVLRNILQTVAHEKLGHGFIFAYSALGQVATRLGLSQIETARRFGLHQADDPSARLREEQSNLVFSVSQFLQEGWATWIESYLDAQFTPNAVRPRYTIQKVCDAAEKLPANFPNRADLISALFNTLGILFSSNAVPLSQLLNAFRSLHILGQILDEFFGSILGQPLCYIIGELLFNQAEMNLGETCLPYATLIAANVTFDPATIGLSDLNMLLTGDPALNPDVRLAALSRMQLTQRNNLSEFVQKAAAELSLTVPDELKKII